MGARRKRGREVPDGEVKIELTPMIDVTFLILVFFLCTLQFKTLEGKLTSYLPRDEGLTTGKPIELEDVELVLEVPSEGGVNLARPVGERRVVISHRGATAPFGAILGFTPGAEGKAQAMRFDPPDTPERVAAYLQRVRLSSEEIRARIHCSPRAPHAAVVFALDLMLEAGFDDVSYAGIPRQLADQLVDGRIR